MMVDVVNRLRTLMASDLMARRVIELAPECPLDKAAEELAAHELSSAPVVDSEGHCIGMLSAADFLKPGQPGVERTAAEVRSLMTPAVQSVSPATPLLQVAQMMSVEHIHHVPVIAQERVVGVVSTMDVVSAMVNAVEEWDAWQAGQ